MLSDPHAAEVLRFCIMWFVCRWVKGAWSGSKGKSRLRLMTRLSSGWGLRWLICEKCFMRMFACCLLDGMVSDVVMASCVCVVLLLDRVMLLMVW